MYDALPADPGWIATEAVGTECTVSLKAKIHTYQIQICEISIYSHRIRKIFIKYDAYLKCNKFFLIKRSFLTYTYVLKSVIF